MSQKSKKTQRFIAVRRLVKKPVFMAVAVIFSLCLIGVPLVRAATLQQQIDSLNAQNDQNQSSVDSLQVKASSYQQAINQLQSKIAGLQVAIASTQAQEAKLQSQIQQAQAELNRQKQILGADIKAMYVDGQMTTVEELATSKNLSDFVDAETYRNAVQGEVQNTLVQISQLENQLKSKKAQVDQLLNAQQSQNSQLSSDEQQQQNLLSFNQSQQEAYTAKIQANNSQITQLEAEQAAAERAAFSGSSSATGEAVSYRNLTGQELCGGGYNFHCSGAQDNWLDQWGEYNRECVSYAAWYEGHVLGKYVPAFGYMSEGNANQWHGAIVETGSADIIYGSSNPSASSLVGDVVYMPIGSLGHVGVVLGTTSDGWLQVGQYNLYDEGMYSSMDLQITPNLEFYHFH